MKSLEITTAYSVWTVWLQDLKTGSYFTNIRTYLKKTKKTAP